MSLLLILEQHILQKSCQEFQNRKIPIRIRHLQASADNRVDASVNFSDSKNARRQWLELRTQPKKNAARWTAFFREAGRF
jgi:hypothetical protein